MLSGETANGKHPALVVATMGALVANAELAVDYKEQYHAIRCGVLFWMYMQTRDIKVLCALAMVVRELAGHASYTHGC
jgi:pyruvate kinase